MDSLSLYVYLVALIGLVRRHHWKQIEANLLLFGGLGSFGIILWLAWNKIIFGDPLYFQHGTYSSQAQMQYYFSAQLSVVRHNLWQSARYYGFTCLDTLGPIVSILALVATVKFVIRRQGRPEVLAALSFLTPLAFYVFSFYSAQVISLVPGVSSQLFNARFGSEAVLPAALFMSTISSIGTRLPRLRVNLAIQSLLSIVLIIQAVLIASNGIISLQEGQYGSSCTARQTVDIYLAQHYNGGLILEDIYLGSPDESQEVGIHLKNIIYQGSGDFWKRALKNPGAMVDWVLIGERDPGSPYPVQVNTTSPLFKSQFTLVVHNNQGFDLYVRNGLPPLPARPIPANLLAEHQFCDTGKYPQKGEW